MACAAESNADSPSTAGHSWCASPAARLCRKPTWRLSIFDKNHRLGLGHIPIYCRLRTRLQHPDVIKTAFRNRLSIEHLQSLMAIKIDAEPMEKLSDALKKLHQPMLQRFQRGRKCWLSCGSPRTHSVLGSNHGQMPRDLASQLILCAQ